MAGFSTVLPLDDGANEKAAAGLYGPLSCLGMVSAKAGLTQARSFSQGYQSCVYRVHGSQKLGTALGF